MTVFVLQHTLLYSYLKTHQVCLQLFICQVHEGCQLGHGQCRVQLQVTVTQL